MYPPAVSTLLVVGVCPSIMFAVTWAIITFATARFFWMVLTSSQPQDIDDTTDGILRKHAWPEPSSTAGGSPDQPLQGGAGLADLRQSRCRPFEVGEKLLVLVHRLIRSSLRLVHLAEIEP